MEHANDSTQRSDTTNRTENNVNDSMILRYMMYKHNLFCVQFRADSVLLKQLIISEEKNLSRSFYPFHELRRSSIRVHRQVAVQDREQLALASSKWCNSFLHMLAQVSCQTETRGNIEALDDLHG